MQFIGSRYDGEKTVDQKRFHGIGQYTFANGDCYVGEFCDGNFHGHGVIFYRQRPTTSLHGRSLAVVNTNSSNTDTARSHGIAQTNSKLLTQLMSISSNDTQRRDRSRPSNAEVSSQLPPSVCTSTSEQTNHTTLVATTNTLDSNRGEGSHWSQPSARAAGTTATANKSAPTRWEGQYRGVWVHGHNVSGSYVFADGLVYGGRASLDDSAEEQAASLAAVNAWPYCQSNDHRLWQEHLRHITPLLPYETILLGGDDKERTKPAADLQSDRGGGDYSSFAPRAAVGYATGMSDCRRVWAALPVIVPTLSKQEITPPSFQRGQLRDPSDLTKGWWKGSSSNSSNSSASREGPTVADAEESRGAAGNGGSDASAHATKELAHMSMRERVVYALKQPTIPLQPEDDPDVQIIVRAERDRKNGKDVSRQSDSVSSPPPSDVSRQTATDGGAKHEQSATNKPGASVQYISRHVSCPNLELLYVHIMPNGSRQLLPDEGNATH